MYYCIYYILLAIRYPKSSIAPKLYSIASTVVSYIGMISISIFEVMLSVNSVSPCKERLCGISVRRSLHDSSYIQQ